MAMSIGATKSNSANKANTSSFTFTHTIDASTKCLVVVVTGVDSSATDSVVNSVVWDAAGINQGLTEIAGGRYRVGNDFISIWYKSNVTVLSNKSITVSAAGACTDIQATAVNLVDANAISILYDNYDTGTGTGSASSVVSPARTGSIAIGGGVVDGGLPASLSITTGSEITGSETDMGSQVASVGSASESGGSATITWTYAAVVCSSLAATFYSQYAPTVALDDPTDTETDISTTPELFFTGTDTNGDAIEYNIQVAQNNVFGINHDADSNSGAKTTQTTYSWNHTVSGFKTALVVGVTTRPSPVVVSGITWNGTAMTKAAASEVTNGDRYSVVYYIANAELGTHAIEVTLSGGTPTESGAIASSFNGVDQIAPLDSANAGFSASTNNPGVNITTVANNAWLFDCLCESNNETSQTATSPQVKITSLALGNSSMAASYMGPVSPAAMTLMSWNMTTGSTAYGGISLKPAPIIDKFSETPDPGFSGGKNPIITNLDHGTNQTDGTSTVTDSVSPAANSIILLGVDSATSITTDPVQPTISGCGLTWSIVNSVSTDNSGASRRKLFLFKGLGTASAGQITIDFGSQTQVTTAWNIDQVTGCNLTNPVVQSVTNTIPNGGPAGTSLTATLSAFGNVSNIPYGVLGAGGSLTYPATAGSGFTKLSDEYVEDVELATEWKNTNDTTVDFTFGSDEQVGLIAAEIRSKHPFPSGEQETYTIQAGTIIDSYSESNQNQDNKVYGSEGKIGQSFTGNGTVLGKVNFYMKKLGSPTGNAVVKIYDHTGTFGSTGKPAGTVLATSDNFNISSLTTNYQLIDFTFSGANQITLANSTNYCAVFEYLSGDINNCPLLGNDTTGGHSGNRCYFLVGSWQYDNSGDVPFYIYGINDTLTVNTVYYWRVKGKDPLGANTYGVWSDIHSFTTESGVPPRRIFMVT